MAAPESQERPAAQYGTLAWLESRYRNSDEDPWGLSWRGIEQARYESAVELLRRDAVPPGDNTSRMIALDVGCSTGHFTHLLGELDFKVVGIDLSETAITRARLLYPDLSFRTAAVTDLIQHSEQYDLLTCLEVLYYVEKERQDGFLQEIRAALKPDRRALVSSVIGSPPYFQPDELVALLSRHFRVQSAEGYGCVIWAKLEGRLFSFWDRADRVRRMLRSEVQQSEVVTIGASTRWPTRLAGRVLYFASRRRLVRTGVAAILGATTAMIKALLRARSLPKLCNTFAHSWSLQRTHTHIIVYKDRTDGQRTAAKSSRL